MTVYMYTITQYIAYKKKVWNNRKVFCIFCIIYHSTPFSVLKHVVMKKGDKGESNKVFVSK